MQTEAFCEAIIVAEDHLELRKTLSEVLTEEGFLTFAAKDGHEAFGVILTADYPCLIFLDFTMPGCDGRQLVEMLSQRPGPKPPVRIVITSGSEEAETYAREQKLIFLKKPVNLETFLATAHRFCKVRKKHL